MERERRIAGDRALRRERRQPRGLALVLVLWVLALLSLLAAGFLTATRSEMLAVRARIDAARAEALADGAVHWAIARLLRAEVLSASGDAAWPPLDGRPLALRLPGGEAEVRIQDAGGLIDLNAAEPPLLAGLLSALGLSGPDAERLLARLLDFRDADSVSRPDGAEDADYAAIGLPYGAKDGPLDRVDELRQIPGFSPALVRRIAPLVTTLSGARGVDPTTAPEPVLAAVPGLGRSEIANILGAREQGLDAADFAGRGRSGFVASGRTSFRILAVAEAEGGGRFAREAVIQLRSGPDGYRIRRWEQAVIDTSPTR